MTTAEICGDNLLLLTVIFTALAKTVAPLHTLNLQVKWGKTELSLLTHHIKLSDSSQYTPDVSRYNTCLQETVMYVRAVRSKVTLPYNTSQCRNNDITVTIFTSYFLYAVVFPVETEFWSLFPANNLSCKQNEGIFFESAKDLVFRLSFLYNNP